MLQHMKLGKVTECMADDTDSNGKADTFKKMIFLFGCPAIPNTAVHNDRSPMIRLNTDAIGEAPGEQE